MENLGLNELREKRWNLLLALGEECHKVLRQEDESINDKMRQLSAQIKAVDVEINGQTNPMDQTCCPQCHKKLTDEEAFCSECGFGVQKYYAAYVAKCKGCSAPMKEDQQYCTVCGTKQGNDVL